jgi:uncharacterized membrane protein YbhN (UPF0104 family)
LYAAFLTISGAIAVLLHWQLGEANRPQLAIVPAYALAWLSGYAVPGASGGLGIREATLVLLLGDSPESVFVALGMRVVTTIGEVLWFVVSSLVGVPATGQP